MDSQSITLGGGATTAAPGSSGNEKRKESCKRVGGEKKRKGHKVEDLFMARFGKPTATTYKAEADCTITRDTPDGAELIETFSDLSSHRVSVKSGNNLQFTLGRIDELTSAEDKIAAVSQRTLWEKYLGKSTSSAPADLLAYREEGCWIIFRMQAVIDFIVSSCVWRQLDSGRLKGDFFGRQFLTYEYRSTHKSHFLGANGNKGVALIHLLQDHVPCVIVEDK